MKCAFVVLCVLVATVAAISNHWGQRSTNIFWLKNDHKIYLNTITATPVRGFAVSRDVKFPQYVSFLWSSMWCHPYYLQVSKYSQNITYIEAIDNFRNSSGGHAMIIEGGPTFNNTHIKLVSMLNNGLNFTIKMYGKWYY